MATAQRDYIAYLLRLWRVDGPAGFVWHVALENPHSGERIGFANMEALFDYLRRQTSFTPAVDLGQDPPTSQEVSRHWPPAGTGEAV